MDNRIIMAAVAAGMSVACVAQDGRPAYPVTAKVDTVDVYFGERVPDPYRWLEDDRSEATSRWVEAQNAVTSDYLSKIPFRGKLLQRLTSLVDYERMSVPFKKNGRYYFFRNDGLQNQSVLYVQNTLQDAPKVFFDPNTLSSDGTVALRSQSFSRNGKYFAYTISRSGSDWEEIFVLDANTGRQLSDHIVWAKFTGATWVGDGFYYSAYDAPASGTELSGINENHKVYYHKIGTPQSDDVLVFSDAAHPKRFYTVGTTKEETHLFLYESGEGSGNALYVKDLGRPDGGFLPMSLNMSDSNYPIEVAGGKIYIYTTSGAPMGRVMAADTARPGIDHWTEVVPEAGSVLSSAEIIGGRMVLTYNKDACDHAYVCSLVGKRLAEIELPSPGSVSFRGDKDDRECFYSFTSFTVPGAVYRYDTGSNVSTLYHAPKVAFRSADYVTEQIFFSGKDGARVPMFLTYKKGLKRNGANPVLLYGYGGFNIGLTPSFSASRIPFIENGGIYVTVNLRGGNEYGEAWHQAGTKMRKQNVFDDFISAAEYLVANNYTNPGKTAIMGGSNGGLLVGACMAQRPDLYRAVVAQVGVMDMLRYHKFTIGWNWADDYGTSADSKEMFEYLRRYSPLHALRPGVEYPATLVTTADHDDRVVPAHSFKFAARLQECNASSAPTLIRIDSKAGHGGGKPVAKQLEETADEYSFIMHNLGMDYK